MQFDQLKRREFITLLGGAAAGGRSRRARSSPSGCGVIGVLSGSAADDQDDNVRLAAFQQRLQQLGWTDGHNVRIDYRFAAGNPENYRKYAAELVALAPDVILAPGAFSGAICSRPPARCRSCSRSLPIRSAQASSKVCRGRAATPPAFCSSNTI